MTNALIPLKKLSKGERYLSREYVQKIYDLCDNPRDKTYLMYHIETGLRVSDVVETEIVHIDWKNLRTLTHDIKKDKWRHVYFPLVVKSQLSQWLLYRQAKGIKDKRLFPFSAKTANRILKSWATKINFPYASEISSHWLRHTYIRYSRAIGRDIKAVQVNTGDTIKTLLDWYSDLDPETLQRESEKTTKGEI